MSLMSTIETPLKIDTKEQDVQTNQTGYLMALSMMKGFGPRTLRRLIDAAGGKVQAVWDANDAFLSVHLTKKEKQAFLHERERLDSIIPQNLPAAYQQQGISLIAITDALYPVALKEIYDPPLLLYVKGNIDCLQKQHVSVVGNRSITDYGRKATQALIAQMAESLGQEKEKVCITSGLAEGVDGQAHQSALDYGIQTVAVFGCGIDIIFPKFHEALAKNILDQGGAWISEYPFGTPGTKYTYPQRNRIVAGMASTVLVIEGSIRSGSLITAKLAVEEGRQVLAVPGSIFVDGSQGPHQLIQQGAIPVTHGKQVLEAMGLMVADSEPSSVRQKKPADHVKQSILSFGTQASEIQASDRSPSDHSRTLSDYPDHPLLKLIPSNVEQSHGILLDTLALQSGQTIQSLQEELVGLELDGWVLQLPGGRVVKCAQ